jgi:hypothetical protein
MPKKRRRRSVYTWDRKVHHDYLAAQRASVPHTKEGKLLNDAADELLALLELLPGCANSPQLSRDSSTFRHVRKFPDASAAVPIATRGPR